MEKSHPPKSIHEHDGSTPAFREREEASSIELFYDLFFVANLTSFTTVHAIDDKETISSYIGFFAILWFTWLQVVMLDVRFGVDSLFKRVAKLIHFAVMITFAIIGTKFDPSSPHETYPTMRQLSLCLFVSRLVLICQPWWSSSARANGGVSASNTPNLSERCGLLTLIILGEGIIVLTKSINYVVKGANLSPGIIAQIISAVLIIPQLQKTPRSMAVEIYSNRTSTSSTCSTSTPALLTRPNQPATTSGPSPTSPFTSPWFSLWKVPPAS
ncbi:MAG: hypothetical protein LQ339_008530 [Xanthoria mediterranea]|nr:MAG: hypothetical protein LQ339_008530 [Xanthoria mediterranea]